MKRRRRKQSGEFPQTGVRLRSFFSFTGRSGGRENSTVTSNLAWHQVCSIYYKQYSTEQELREQHEDLKCGDTIWSSPNN